MPATSRPYVVEIKTVGTIISEEAINVFHYASETLTNSISDMATSFEDTILEAIAPILSTNMFWTAIELQFVRGSTMFGSFPITFGGAVSGDSLPPYACWDFTFVRGAALERNGYKRFSGIPESLQAYGSASSGALANLTNAAIAMQGGFATDADVWVPVIQRKVIHHVNQHPPVYYDISGVIYSKIGTQNSRKFGHGR
jgi:hypothetical protein